MLKSLKTLKQLYDLIHSTINLKKQITLSYLGNPSPSINNEQIDKLQTGFPQNWNGEQIMQMYLEDAKGNDYGLDQAERMNAFNFNKFKDWHCNAGYQSCIIRGDKVKRAYSCSDIPLGTLQGGFKLFKTPSKCVTSSCVSSADSKIPKVLHES